MSTSDRAQAADSSSLDEACGKAMTLQLAGQADQAAQLYRTILQAQPTHGAANHCFGMLQVQLERPADGLPYLLAALNAHPELPDYWLGYLEALLLAGQNDVAAETLALARQHGLSGVAVEEFARRLDAPHAPDAHAPRQPPASTRAERRREARLTHRQDELLLALMRDRRFADALALARSITERFPEHGPGWKVLGVLLGADGNTGDALAAMQASVRLCPTDAEAHSNLGTVLTHLRRYADAETCHRRALKLDPASAAAHYRLGMTYESQGRYAEAEAVLRSGLALRAGDAEGDHDQNHSNLLFILSRNAALEADALFAEHCRYGEYVEEPLRVSWQTHANLKVPERRLQVGFVSGDFHDHAVGVFIEPVLARLSLVPGLCLHVYYNNVLDDAVTTCLRASVKHWHAIAALSDRELAEKIMDDRIDILIDLSGHTARNRLRVFAHKPAPIQVSWLGYPGTTGLRSVDYYLADRHWLPPGEFDAQFTEKLVYLPDRWAFQPHATAPAVNVLPALSAGHVTFGSFNRMGKLNPSTLRLWGPLLRALPDARMLLGGMPSDGEQRQLIDGFAAAGIARERLLFHNRGTMDSYLALHHRVDLCLDTHPYAGGTTTMHALSMGVPTLTLAGSTSFGRAGAGILGQLGLEEFIAGNTEDFLEKGLYWAEHLAALAEVRSSLRARLQQSPERQTDRIVLQLELALRHMWRRWCTGLPAESFHSASL
jgi:predicted O-linked N-acetylglucosamine transferase (SPINDLY family)